MAGELKVKAVTLKKEYGVYVEGKGVRTAFQASSEKMNAFEPVYSIDEETGGVIMVSDCVFNHLSHVIKVPYEGVTAVYYFDE